MSTERLLVVDDDPEILALCHRILEADGYSVVDARRGEEALAKLEAESFDLLLTDIRLPGLNGLEVTRHLRERGIELTVVTMTGYSNMEMAIQALSLGVDEFLVKPFTLDSLRLTIARALEKSRLRREIVRLDTLVPLLRTSMDFASAHTRAQVYDRMVESSQLLFKTEHVAFIELDRDDQMLTVAAAHGSHLAAMRGQTFHTAQLVGASELLALGAVVWNERATPRLPFDLPDVSWIVSAPFVVRGQPRGLFLASVASAPPSSDQEALRLIAAYAAFTLENVDLVGEISRVVVTARKA